MALKYGLNSLFQIIFKKKTFYFEFDEIQNNFDKKFQQFERDADEDDEEFPPRVEGMERGAVDESAQKISHSGHHPEGGQGRSHTRTQGVRFIKNKFSGKINIERFLEITVTFYVYF